MAPSSAVIRESAAPDDVVLMNTVEAIAPPTRPVIAPVDHGAELKRGALVNTIALLASNFRGIFAFLVARLLGAAALGTYLVAWTTVELLSKIGLFGLDNAIVAFIARAEAVGDHARSHALFRLAVCLALLQSLVIAVVAFIAIRFFGDRLGLDRQLAAGLSLMLCALPGLALYSINTAVSRGMKVMKHDIFSRGVTQSIVTSVAFLLALAAGLQASAPALAAVLGMTASGIVALALAWSLFRAVPTRPAGFSYRAEAARLLSYSAHISAYDVLNALIVRMDVIMLACFIGRAPGVTLPVVGIYGAVVEVASGLRKVNQSFTPDLRARHRRVDCAWRTGTRRGRLLACRPMDALGPAPPARGSGFRRRHNPLGLWP